MTLIDFQIAGRNLLKHTKRNLLLGGAIASVTALLVIMGALTEGIRSAMLESASTLLTGHVNVGGFFKIPSGTGAPLVTDFGKVLAETRRLVPELDYVTVRGRGWAKAVSERRSMDLVLAGVDVASEPGFTRVVRLKEGSLEELSKPGTILLFEDQAKRLEVGIGDAITLSAPTTRGMNNTADVRVVAIARNLGILSAWTGFLPADTLRQLYQLNANTTGALHVYLKDPGGAPRGGGAAGRGPRAGGLGSDGSGSQAVLGEAHGEGELRELGRAEARRHHLGGRAQLHQLDPQGHPGAHRPPHLHPPRHRRHRYPQHARHRRPGAHARDRHAARHRHAAQQGAVALPLGGGAPRARGLRRGRVGGGGARPGGTRHAHR